MISFTIKKFTFIDVNLTGNCKLHIKKSRLFYWKTKRA